MRPQRFNDLEVRLAETSDEVDAAQALRYRVFYEEMGASPTDAIASARRDTDPFDLDCDHLVLLNHSRNGAPPAVVGTYRLMRSSVARRKRGFYSAQEYDLSTLETWPGEILELGRSCIAAEHRTGAAMLLLWRGIAGYIVEHDIDIMFGCGSLPGTDPAAFALPLSYLHHHHLAPDVLRTRALTGRYVDMRFLPKHQVSVEAALAALPPLLKGYIRLGGYVGDGAVIDHGFNTVDVCIIVETARLTAKYARHYMDQPRRGLPS